MRNEAENLDLFIFDDESIGSLELFPEVWKAMEQLISEDINERKLGIETIEESNALRLSPIVAYYTATRLHEPDIDLRFRIVQVLGGLLRSGDDGDVTPKEVRHAVKHYLMLQRRRGIWNLLEVAAKYMVSEPNVKALIALNPFAGEILGDIFSDRRAPQDIRHQAIVFAGLVGFLETIPVIERLIDRLESKANGQSRMAFMRNHYSTADEGELLPIARATLELLKEP